MTKKKTVEIPPPIRTTVGEDDHPTEPSVKNWIMGDKSGDRSM